MCIRDRFDTLIRGEPLNSGPQNLASRKKALLYVVHIFTEDYFVLSQFTHLTDRRTDVDSKTVRMQSQSHGKIAASFGGEQQQ